MVQLTDCHVLLVFICTEQLWKSDFIEEYDLDLHFILLAYKLCFVLAKDGVYSFTCWPHSLGMGQACIVTKAVNSDVFSVHTTQKHIYIYIYLFSRLVT